MTSSNLVGGVYNVLDEKGCAFAKVGDGFENQIFLSQKRGCRAVRDKRDGGVFFLQPKEGELVDLPKVGDRVLILEAKPNEKGQRRAHYWALLTPWVEEGLRVYRAHLTTRLPGRKPVISPKFGINGATLWEIEHQLREDTNLIPAYSGMLGSVLEWEVLVEGKWVACGDPLQSYQHASASKRGGTEVPAELAMASK